MLTTSRQRMEQDNNIVTSLSKKLVISDNSNNIRVKVTLKDNAGNSSSKVIRFSIDKTAPVVNITYDNNRADNTNADIFKDNRTATIRVTERNFNADDVKIKITNSENTIPALSKWTTAAGTGNGDSTTNTATITYNVDGDYTFDITYSDNAANKSTPAYGNSAAPSEFTIDKTNPTIAVAYDNNNAANGAYYQNGRTATITIVEHNFSADRFTMTARENGQNSAKAVGNWTTNGDRHTATVNFNTEAEVAWTATYTDMAGNRVANGLNENFTVDAKAPTLLVTGVENNKAYTDATVAITVTAADTYFDKLSSKLTRIDSKGQTTNVEMTSAAIENGQSYSVANISEDGIYTLASEVTDKSGRIVNDSRTFSVNRKGSTFAITDQVTAKLNNSYVNEAGDVVLFETNVSKLDMNKVTVTLYRDTEIIELKLNEDYTIDVEETDGEWCKYTYTIKKENFEADGRYKISVYSEDGAGNVALSDNKDKNATLEFVVDKTNPICNIIDLKKNNTYAVNSKVVEFTVDDNIELQTVVVELNGKEVLKLSDKELTEAIQAGNLSFNIDSSNASQDVIIKCIDKAGNEEDTEISNFYVTTNLLIRYTHNTTMIWISIIALVVVVGGVAFIIINKSKKKKSVIK